MEAKDTVMTPEEIKQGCSAYIDHGGGIGSPCRFKPTLRYNGKLYCTRHNPVRLKAISDKRSAEFIEGMNRAEQSRKDNDERLRKEGRQAGIREVVEKIDNTGLIEHTDSPLHETGATILDCPACCWYAYKKEWGMGL